MTDPYRQTIVEILVSIIAPAGRILRLTEAEMHAEADAILDGNVNPRKHRICSAFGITKYELRRAHRKQQDLLELVRKKITGGRIV